MHKPTHKYLIELDRNNTNFSARLFEHFKNTKWDDAYSFLKYYQNIVRSFMNDVKIDSRGLLVAHDMGLGKSILAVAIAIDNIKERQPIIMLTKSLQENMVGSIYKYIDLRRAADPDFYLSRLPREEIAHWIKKHFSFVSMNASNMLKQMNKAAEGKVTEELDAVLEKKFGEILKLASLDGKLLIVDEAHNFFRAITNGSKNALGLYDMIMNAKDLKIIFLTGTPIANDPFELVPCFNMIGSASGVEILPTHYKDFNRLFVDTQHGRIRNKEKFQNRILGLVSHVNHKSQPGKAFNIVDPSAKVEFPEQLPIIIERVNMDPEQYVMYQLARDKEKEEGGGSGRFLAKAFVPAAAAPLTKPKSKAASTYRVKSRQLSNFSPPSGLRDEKDPRKIPKSDLAAAKYREILANINKHRGQIGIVYSQFVGVGGLGTFAAYLESEGWAQFEPGKAYIPEPIESIESIDAADEVDLHSLNKSLTGGDVDGPYIPSVDVFLTGIESEVKSAGACWWLNESSEESDSAEPIGSNDSIDVTFGYAKNANEMSKINPEYKPDPAHFAYPHYVLIVYENDEPTGYAHIEYDITDHACAGKMNEAYLQKISPEIGPDVIKKLILDAIVCGKDSSQFKKTIWGGATSNAPRKYAIISGDVPIEERTRIQDIFNSEENKHGGIIDLILISSTGAEGLDLKNGRHVHIMEMYWNWGRIEQIIHRLVRSNSHIAMAADEKNVQPYIYLAIPPENERLSNGEYPDTTDTELYNEAIANQLTIESFNEALHEVSIECMVNAESYCRACNPTNSKLYTNDVERDIKAIDPCKEMRAQQVTAEEVIVDGVKYYYTPDQTSIWDYRVFIFDKDINSYRPLKESDPLYEKIIDVIVAKKQLGEDKLMVDPELDVSTTSSV